MVEIISHPRLHFGYRLVLLYLREVGEFEGTGKQLGDILNISSVHVNKALKALVEFGYISKETVFNPKDRRMRIVKVRYLGK